MMRIGPDISIAANLISQLENPHGRVPLQTNDADSHFTASSQTARLPFNHGGQRVSIPGAKFQPPDNDATVTWARELKDKTVVYELKDKVSGAVRVQVPSDEVLGVGQSIASDLNQAEKIGQQKEIEGAEGRNTNVSKL